MPQSLTPSLPSSTVSFLCFSLVLPFLQTCLPRLVCDCVCIYPLAPGSVPPTTYPLSPSRPLPVCLGGIECELIDPSAHIFGDERLLCAIVCNVHYVARTLSEHPDIRPFIDRRKLSVVGAYYAFSGVVSFFDDQDEGGWMERGRVFGGVEGNGSLCLSCSGTLSGNSSPMAGGGSKGSSPPPSVQDGVNKSV